MNIWLVSPAWRRYAVTRLALAQRRWLCDELAARGHSAQSVIVADDENLDIAREHGFHTVEMNNSDLGMKFNAGYRYAADQGAELLVHVGSDDWVHPDVFGILDEVDLSQAPELEPSPSGEAIVWRAGPQVVSQRKVTVVCLADGQVQRCNVIGRHGVIPWLIPRVAMESCGFAPIPAGLQRGIDGALARGLARRPNWLYRDAADDWLVDFKTDVNITAFNDLRHNLSYEEPLPLDALAENYPAELVELAKATRLELAGELA